jgi:hypothetical protein
MRSSALMLIRSLRLLIRHNKPDGQGDEPNSGYGHPSNAWPGPEACLALERIYQPTDRQQSADAQDGAPQCQPATRRQRAASRHPLGEAGRAPYVHHPMGYGGHQRSLTVTNEIGQGTEETAF